MCKKSVIDTALGLFDIPSPQMKDIFEYARPAGSLEIDFD